MPPVPQKMMNMRGNRGVRIWRVQETSNLAACLIWAWSHWVVPAPTLKEMPMPVSTRVVLVNNYKSKNYHECRTNPIKIQSVPLILYTNFLRLTFLPLNWLSPSRTPCRPPSPAFVGCVTICFSANNLLAIFQNLYR